LEKVVIALSILRRELSISEASRKHGVSYKAPLVWRKQFLKGGEAA